MARGTSSSKKVKSEKWQFKGFVNYEFTPEEITFMIQWFEGRTFDHPSMIEAWCDVGFKASFSYDAFKNCYVFSATAKKTHSDLDGWVIQFYHTELERLLQVAAYAISEMYPNGGIKPERQQEDRYSW